jgi:uncharacterized OB-fold protein
MPRHLERVSPLHRWFWTGGADGVLRFLRCPECRWYVHPPAPVCPRCLNRDVAPEPVRGTGSVYSFTVNHKRWNDDVVGPYVLAIVELDEQAGLRLTTNLVDCDIAEVAIGMPVEVRFEHHRDGGDDVYVPVFAPMGG